jgi:DNA-binding Lrp family transcriptional regulator
MAYELDDTDKEILHLLQEDARNHANSQIAEAVGLSPSTVSKRLQKLEGSGVIKGYSPNIDYDVAGYPLRVLFICSASITERGDLINETLDIPGVVSAKELMTGNHNLHIEVVGQNSDDITDLAYSISELGIQIGEEVLVKNEYPKPASVFV